eukprot:scaffold8903_cov106-Cylindrotheca_fusiformis.AAC.3
MAVCLIWGTVGFFWLLALRPADWVHVFLIGSIPSVWSSAIKSAWSDRLHCSSDWPSLATLQDVHLGFVGEPDLVSLCSSLRAAPFNGPTIGFHQQLGSGPDRHRRRIIGRVPPPLVTQRVSHQTVGGVTDFHGLFLLRHLPALPLAPAVPMTLRAIIDHKTYLPPWDPKQDKPLTTEASLLPVSTPLTPILIPSRFSPSGFGIRSVTPRELFSAWDLPLWAPVPITRRAAAAALQGFPPLGPLLRLSDAAIHALGPPALPVQGLPLAPLSTSDPSDLHRSWLPQLQCWLPHDWIDRSLLTPKAAKADAAELPTHLWDKRVSLIFPCPVLALERLRSFFFTVACRSLFRSFLRYMRQSHGPLWTAFVHRAQTGGVSSFGPVSWNDPMLTEHSRLTDSSHCFIRDVVVGRLAIKHFTQASWWKWDSGSTPLFWRWPTFEARQAARDGFRFYIKDEFLPAFHAKTKPLKPDVGACLADKVGDLLVKHYVTPFWDSIPPTSQIDYFAVPKVVSPEGEVLDVRLVFNGTSCGLNDALWSPSFWLPTPDTALRKLHFSSQMVDFDLGEFFLNFFLLPFDVRQFTGVNLAPLSKFLGPLAPVPGIEYAWTRLLFGLKPSPYNSIKFYYHAEEYVVGDPTEPGNPLRWDRVKLNLPGDPTFDPRLPWVYQWDDERNSIAGSVVTFVDDGRGSGSSVEHAWQVLHRCASRFQHLGIQVAIRKVRPPAPGVTPGAWAGMIAEVNSEGVFKTVAQSKWDKARDIIDRLLSELEKPEGMEFKPLERDRGFLVHMAATFKAMNPYLKGIHLTLDSWRANRRSDGWKMTPKEWDQYLLHVEDDDLREQLADLANAGHPSHVFPVPRLRGDLETLRSFLSPPAPIRVCVRPSRFVQVVLAFGDASGNGFGGTFLSTEGLSYQTGIWKYKATSSCSFEFRNLLDSLEREGQADRLQDAFVLFMTDNKAVEETLFKGSSKSQDLLRMVQEFHQLEMRFGFVALVVHCAGTRMIAQGTDGLSRGGLNEGVMAGKPMSSFLPLHLDAFERSPPLKDWVKSWAGPDAVFLSPDDWFFRGHDLIPTERSGSSSREFGVKAGVMIWSPPPAAADVALEELRKARIKRQHSTHIVLVPRLCTPMWLKQLYKASDLVLEIPPSCPFWSSDMFEPVFIGILLPFCRFDPWSLRLAPKVCEFQRRLQKMFKTSPVDSGDLLYELLTLSRRIPTMSRGLVRKLLFFGC